MKPFIVTLCLLSTLSLKAQDVQLGFKSGINVANLSVSNAPPDDEADYRSRTGVRIGGFVEVGLSENFAVQPAILYSAKGSELADEPFGGFSGGSDATLIVKFKVNYLSLPVMAKYSFINSGDVQVSAQAGPYVGYLVGAEIADDNELNNINDWDLGAQGGLSADFATGPGSIVLDAQLGFGFIDLNDNDNDSDLNNEASLTNRILPAVTVGYAFDL
jgi:hypothetical protein